MKVKFQIVPDGGEGCSGCAFSQTQALDNADPCPGYTLIATAGYPKCTDGFRYIIQERRHENVAS